MGRSAETHQTNDPTKARRPMPTLPETRAECLARLAYEDAVLLARLEATYPLCDDEPTVADLTEYGAWSQSVQDHDEALNLWLAFFPETERSTFYVS